MQYMCVHIYHAAFEIRTWWMKNDTAYLFFFSLLNSISVGYFEASTPQSTLFSSYINILKSSETLHRWQVVYSTRAKWNMNMQQQQLYVSHFPQIPIDCFHIEIIIHWILFPDVTERREKKHSYFWAFYYIRGKSLMRGHEKKMYETKYEL